MQCIRCEGERTRKEGYSPALRPMLPEVEHRASKYLNNGMERDHGHLKQRWYPMRGFKQAASAGIIVRGHALIVGVPSHQLRAEGATCVGGHHAKEPAMIGHWYHDAHGLYRTSRRERGQRVSHHRDQVLHPQQALDVVVVKCHDGMV